MKQVFILFFVGIIFFSAQNIIYSAEETNYPNNIELVPKQFAKLQTLKIPLKGASTPLPKVVWTQTDEYKWTASRNEGMDTYKVEGQGSGRNARPVPTEVTDKITVEKYPPEDMHDTLGQVYNQKYISDLGFETIDEVPINSYKLKSLKYKKGDIFAVISTETGYGYINNEIGVFAKREDDTEKLWVAYYTPLNINYTGHVVEKKEIQVKSDATLQIDDTEQLTVEVRTKAYNEQEFTDNWIDVTHRDQTKWESSDPAIASVDPATGEVTAHATGTAQITAYWSKDPWSLKDSATITVGAAEEPPTTGPSAICTIPQAGQQLTGKYIDPMVSAIIKADRRGSEMFDVAQGIPTSESLYGNVFALNYLSQHTFTEYTGECTYRISVKRTYKLKWDDGEKKDTKTVNYSFDIQRPYAFWKIDQLGVYGIKQATLNNYAFADNKIIISPNNYIPPSYSVLTTGTYYAPKNPGNQNGGTKNLTKSGSSRPSIPDESSDMKRKAENAVDNVEVENDNLKFNNEIIMDSTRTIKKGPTPKALPMPTMIGKDTLYSANHMIPKTKTNLKNAPSTGTIEYNLLPGNIDGGANQTFPINGINTVTVHTPVVNYSLVSDDQKHNQKTVPDAYSSALILDRPFSVRIPTGGQHVNYPGYGNRDYAKYIRTKQVQFPFDTYNKEQTTFIPKNTWVDVPVNQLDTTFFLPVWVDEGKYDILFRTIAENAPSSFTVQHNANVTLDNHVAVESVAVEVIGRVYDFHITDIADYNWQIVFHPWQNLAVPDGTSYWVGENGIDGAPRGNTAPYVLPVRQGSHPFYRNLAVKTGYHFKFDLKTKGNMFGSKDGIRITPTFHYVPRQGGTPFPVDVYYSTATENLIKIGSPQDTVQRYTILNDPTRHVPEEELKNTALYMYDLLLQEQALPSKIPNKVSHSQPSTPLTSFWNTAWERALSSIWKDLTGLSWETVATQDEQSPLSVIPVTPTNPEEAIAMFSKASHTRKVNIGNFTHLLLTQPLRTLIGPQQHLPQGNNTMRSLAAVQKWYGEYSLPSDVYVVKQGTSLQDVTGSTNTNRQQSAEQSTDSTNKNNPVNNGAKGLDEHSSVFLTDGYIVVNFDIETIQQGDTDHPHLQYIHAPLMNQWQLEGFQKQFNDPWGYDFQLNDGDVLFYHTNKGSRNDFQSSVTH
ncbi:hypothetical protein PTI45_03052 [Paenibacillus nuruki]|uniref:BIG2 domain-containing protein n=1 Tax=Paenibacillus nuruki TaxID=1886670 RepID=A0A1E3L1C2_9BACL|nr:DUF5704 domain-containing protein [Paenibacillus nuruki]ODP27597.1 hypothetical protein PTI45_03052 [Paenibacillus nuruki]